MENHTIDPATYTLGEHGARLKRNATSVGVLALAISAYLGFAEGDAWRHFFHDYLLGYTFVLSIALGSVFFVLIQHITGSFWSTTVRRVAETVMAQFPLVMLMGLPLLYPLLSHVGQDEFGGLLWPWLHPHGAHASLIEGKHAFLNVSFFLIRQVFYFGVWILMARYFNKKSVEQDNSGDDVLPTFAMRKVAAPSMILFAITLTAASFDLLMSLDPAWFSTIFGVYYFSGCVIAIFAFLAITMDWLQDRNLMVGVFNQEHYHDLGKFLFAFVFFWGYIAFSQFMLLWYADIPEETGWYLLRQSDPWTNVSWALLILTFVIPFLGLLSRHVKRSRKTLKFWAWYMLVAHLFDLYYLILPQFTKAANGVDIMVDGKMQNIPIAEPGTSLPLGAMEVLIPVGLFCLFVAGVASTAGKRPLLAKNDPLLPKCLGFHNI